jgi:hypothetical protein
MMAINSHTLAHPAGNFSTITLEFRQSPHLRSKFNFMELNPEGTSEGQLLRKMILMPAHLAVQAHAKIIVVIVYR